MPFNSFSFLYFFIFFYFTYWFVFRDNLSKQNLFLLLSSYIFYAWANFLFLFYLIGSSVFNYFLGIYIEKSKNPKNEKWLVIIGLMQGIGGLMYFKYFNFFITTFNSLFNALHLNINLNTLKILVPLGISFFTFRTLSYILDVQRGKIEAVKDWVVFFNYVSFFPSILSGPIDKARTFVPQLEKKRVFGYNDTVEGLKQILWGFFKKLVIADNCASITTQIFDSHASSSGSELFFGALLYTIQVYADFSGYSDMAIGLSRLIGIKVTKNFDFPFFSQNIAEFWRRWHISLTSWLTEYVYTPLSIAFRDYGKLGLIAAIVINFMIVGIWHGANWTYVLFGFLHGCFYIPLIIRGTIGKRKIIPKGIVPPFNVILNMIGTFTVVAFTFIIFRADNIEHGMKYIYGIFSISFFTIPSLIPIHVILLTMLFMIMEWVGRNGEYAIEHLGVNWNRSKRWLVYFLIIAFIFIFDGEEQQFIYFKF